MLGIIILCVIALILGILLFTPICFRMSYERGEISARIRFGPVKIPLYPRPEPAEEKPEKKSGQAEEKKPKKKRGFKINRQQIFYTLEKLPPILGRALRRAGRRIRIGPLKIHLLVAGDDPADVAALYGELEAALGAGLPALHRLVRVRGQDIRLFLDFQEESMDCVADIGAAVRLWDLLVIGLCAGASAVKWLIGFKKRADAPSAAEAGQHNKANEAGAA